MERSLIECPARVARAFALAPAFVLALAIAGCDSGSSSSVANAASTPNVDTAGLVADLGDVVDLGTVADTGGTTESGGSPGDVVDAGSTSDASSGSADAGDTIIAGDVSDVTPPPVDTPPVDTPPVDTPPVDTPPVDTPPVDTPPVDTPPVDTPPVDTPPVDTPPAVTYNSRTITPSLGLVLSGTVRILALDGTELAAAFTDQNGSATLDIPTDAVGPFLLELSGNDAASYYDEALDTLVPLAQGTVIRAVVADLGDVGAAVTPLTEMAVQYLEQHQGSLTGLTAEQIAAANEFVRTQLAPELTDITLPPTIVGSGADAVLLAGSEADLYALKLAALARVAAANNMLSTAPALEILEEMAADLADGVLDGAADGTAIAHASYNLGTFATQFFTLAQSYNGSNSLTDLLNSLTQYVSPEILALLTPPGDGGGIVLPTPGDLLASWTGNYTGGWNQVITTSGNGLLGTTLSTLLAPAMQTAFGISSGNCAIGIGSDSITIGTQTFAFSPTLAVAAIGGNRTYNLPANFNISVLGITVASTGSFTLNTGSATPGSGSVSLGASISGPFGLSASANYSGTCAVN